MDDDRRFDPPPDVIETHLSVVFLSADRAYKLLKPVRTPFVDFSGRSDRLAAATRELELNSRVSPDVYLGLADCVEAGEVVDRMIVMRRLPADRQLDRLLHDPDLETHLRDAAKLIATFHSSAKPLTGPAATPATVEALARNWADNMDALAPLAGPLIPVSEYEQVNALVKQYLSGRGILFAERIEEGWVCDGHGDLRCEHLFCMDDGPRLIDCLAFRDDLRVNDVLNDVAFLAMDLHRLAGPAAARSFMNFYEEFTNESHPPSLAHHYVAYRASVRAKVAAIRFGQGDAEAAADVLAYHDIALQHLTVGQPRLILVGGGAGVGKSTVAGGLADRLAMTWLRADEIRKDLAGIDHDQHAFSAPNTGIYAPEFTDLAYREMHREARLLLERGESVILDASWSSERHRAEAREVARLAHADIYELHCDAPRSVARERIARRMASLYNPSDATPEIADHLAAEFDPWPCSKVVNTNQAVARSIDAAYGHIMHNKPGASSGTAISVETELTQQTVAFFVSRIRGTVLND